MGVRVYHQVGHFPVWNTTSLEVDLCGDGLILSPVHQSYDVISALSPQIRARSLFDPQYYLPNSPKAKLATYSFFPQQISGGFSTADFPLVALESAKRCIAFQLDQGFEAVVIPARFLDQMATKYFERQEEYTVIPFLKAASELQINVPLYLTVPLTASMLQDEGFRIQLLNWITGFPEISGAYVLVNDERRTKQIQSSDFLFAHMEFLHQLRRSGLSVIAGHLNSESVPLSIIDGITLTFGSFENTRMFSLDKFLESDEERRAPKSRIYLPGLLNWIQFDQATQIRLEAPDLWSRIYTPTAYADRVFGRGVEPYFNQPDLYKHHFVCMHAQLKALGVAPTAQRFALIRDQIRAGMRCYQAIEEMPLDLDVHGGGGHLQAWLDALNKFSRAHLQ